MSTLSVRIFRCHIDFIELSSMGGSKALCLCDCVVPRAVGTVCT